MKRFTNTTWADVKPTLSILIPFYHDDPSGLLQTLAKAASSHGAPYEVVLLDDGTNDGELTQKLHQQISQLPFATALISASQNLGRANGRNALADESRGDYILFIDADMLPDSPAFLDNWLHYIRSDKPEIVFGGFSVIQASSERQYAVHKSMAQKSDCLPAKQRQMHAEKYVFTSNLLIRKDIFKAYPFDGSFTGWGWEDVEWAMRVSKTHRIEHIDNTATHLGLDTVPSLMGKYQQSAPNFVRVVRTHPDIVAEYPAYKMARLFNTLGIGGTVSAISARIAKMDALPAPARALALRFYRSALYAEALSNG